MPLPRRQLDKALVEGLRATFPNFHLRDSEAARLVRERFTPKPEPTAFEQFVERVRNPLGGVAEKVREGIENDRLIPPQSKALANMVPAFLEGATELSDERGNPNVDIAFVGPLRGGAKAAKSLADQYVNFSKMGLSDEAAAALRQRVDANAAAELAPDLPGALPNPKPTLPDKVVEAQAKKLDPESLLALKPLEVGEGAYPPAVAKALRDYLNGSMEELVKATRAAEEAVSPADQMIARAKAQRIEKDVDKLVQLQSAARSEAGRGLRAWRLMAESNTEPAFWLARAQQKAGGKLPEGKSLELNSILEDIGKAPTEEAKSAAKMRLAKWMHQFEQDGLTDVLLAWRKAGLVSGIKSHARNLGGNMSFAAMREVAQVPEWISDVGFSLFTKQRTIGTPGVGVARGMKDAATKGAKEAAQTWRHGMTSSQAQKWDMPRELNSVAFGGGKVDKAVNWWVNRNFRALGAEDKLFRAYAYRRAVDDGAQAMAATARLQGSLPSGTSVGQYAKQLRENPSKALMAEAMYQADYAVFANKNALASWVNSGKQSNDGLKVGLDLLMPFVTTPANIFGRIFEYTPVGAGVKAAKQAPSIWKSGLGKEQQKVISEAIGRGATGSALMMAGWWMAEQGRLTGMPSPSPGERSVDNAAGRQAFSYKDSDGEWRRINEFAPGAPVLTLGATLFEESRRPLKEEASRPDKVVGAAAATFKEFPLMQGVEILNRSMQNPTNAAESYAREQLGTMVPTLAADIGRYGDERVRSSYGKDASLLAKAQERIPGARKSLPASRDVFGRPLKADPRHMLDPTLPRKESDDPVLKEMVKIRAGVGRLKQEPNEPDEQYRLRAAVRGAMVYHQIKRRKEEDVRYKSDPVIRGLLNIPGAPTRRTWRKEQKAWSNLTDLGKRDEVKSITSAVSRQLNESLEGKDPAARIPYLKALFASFAESQPELGVIE